MRVDRRKPRLQGGSMSEQEALELSAFIAELKCGYFAGHSTRQRKAENVILDLMAKCKGYEESVKDLLKLVVKND